MKKISLTLFMVFSIEAVAGWQSGKIAKLLVHDNGGGTEKFDVLLSETGSGGMDWCGNTRGWTAMVSNDAAKLQYSMLLAAYMPKKEVIIHSDGSAVCPDTHRNRVRNVELK